MWQNQWNTTESVQTSDEGGLTLLGSEWAKVTDAKFKQGCLPPLHFINSRPR